jgi:hypothetical protein
MSTLTRLLDDNVRFALSHKGTVNHLPMALIALQAMGATDARLTQFFDWWEANIALPRTGDEAVVTRDGWQASLGRYADFAPMADMFRLWIEVEGAERVVGAVAPSVAGAPGSLAFHAPIRLAYGLDAGHPSEIAAGLASWVAAHRNLGLDATTAPRAGSVAEGLDAISAAWSGHGPMGGMITAAMATVAAEPAFRGALRRAPAEGAALLPALSRAAIRLYWQFPNFTVLHMVTGVHAARVICERVPALATPAFSEALWRDWCAAYATVGAPRYEGQEPAGAAPDWDAIFAAAVASDDDHVIKLSYSCHAEAARYDDPAYRIVASRLVGLG